MIVPFGILLLAAVCQGSFGLGYKNYSPFSWAAFWGIYDVLCIVTSTLFCLVLVPDAFGIFAEAGIKNLMIPVACGCAWGLSAIGFSKGIDKIGMSLVYGISMGISTIVGSLVPMLKAGDISKSPFFWLGLMLTLAGVILVTVAGIKRDGGVSGSVSGILLAVFSGVGSGFMNVGYDGCVKLTSSIVEGRGYGELASSSLNWLPVLVGGCIAGLLYCIGEVGGRNQWHTITAKGSGKMTLKLFGVSIVWYAALMLYGFSANLLGEIGSTVGWILFNALALVISVAWGLRTGEWKNSKKGLLFFGCGVLILSWIALVIS